MLCSSLENVWEECRRKVDGDPSVGPIDIFAEDEVAMCHEGGFESAGCHDVVVGRQVWMW